MQPSDVTYELRLLVCLNCGAPMRTAPAGGSVRCEYCAAVHALAPRSESRVEPATEPSREDRLAGLRAQLVTSHRDPFSFPPPELRKYFHVDASASSLLDEAASQWREESRRAAALQGNDVRYYWLTQAARVLCQKTGDHLRARAYVETASELARDPRVRALLRISLANRALDIGDLAAAEAWLAPVDPASAELAIHSSYVCVHARAALLRGDADAVFRWIGKRRGDVPVMLMLSDFTCALRASAHEQRGNLNAALDALWEVRHGLVGRIAGARRLAVTLQSVPSLSCARSYELFLRRLRRRRLVAMAAILLAVILLVLLAR